MSRQTEEIVIDDNRFMVTHFSVEKGLEMTPLVGKVVGKPLTMMFVEGNKGEGNILEKDLDPEVFGNAVQCFFTALNPPEYVKFVKDLLNGVEILSGGEHRQVNLNLDFMDKEDVLYKLLSKVLIYQFGFLKKLVGNIPTVPAKVLPQVGRVKAL